MRSSSYLPVPQCLKQMIKDKPSGEHFFKEKENSLTSSSISQKLKLS